MILSKEGDPTPFYFRIKEDIKKRILSGEFSEGELLTPELKLMLEYNVSRITIIRALSELAQEGFLLRMQGKGSIVKKPAPRLSADILAGMIMPASGHVFGEISRTLIRGLDECQYYPVNIDFHPSDSGSMEKIKNLVAMDPAVLIIDGIISFPFKVLENYGGRILFINRFEDEKEYKKAAYVLVDYREGGRKACEHFISCGFKKILYITARMKPRSTQFLTCEGAREVLRENGMPAGNFEILMTEDANEIRRALESCDMPAAVFCDGDHRAKSIYRTARELRFRIPEDVMVCGYYDTPWCDVFEPHLTSVSIREKEIAQAAAGLVADKNSAGESIIITPRLNVRGSSKNGKSYGGNHE